MTTAEEVLRARIAELDRLIAHHRRQAGRMQGEIDALEHGQTAAMSTAAQLQSLRDQLDAQLTNNPERRTKFEEQATRPCEPPLRSD